MKTFILKVQDKSTGEFSTRQIVQSDAFKAHQVAKKHWGDTHVVRSITIY